MRIDIMTLFPDTVGDVLCESILGRAQERGYIKIECHQIRDYTCLLYTSNRPGRELAAQTDYCKRCKVI